MNPTNAIKWLSVQETLDALQISRTTLHRRIKGGEFETEKRNGRLKIGVPLKQLMEHSLEQGETSETTIETSETNGNIFIQIELEAVRRERDTLRDEVEQLREDLKRTQVQLSQQAQQTQDALASIRALTEQNERLTLLLANEQAHRMKVLDSRSKIGALPKPFGWIARLLRGQPRT